MSHARGCPHKRPRTNGDDDDDDDDDAVKGKEQNPKPRCSHSVNMRYNGYCNDDHELSVGDNDESLFDLREAQLDLAKLSCSLGRNLIIDPSFRRVMERIHPLFTVKPEQYVRDLVDVFKEDKSRVMKTLASLDSQISISIDWLGYGDDDFICLAAHFIDDKWKLKKWVLKFWGGNDFIHQTMLKAMKEWGIEGKVLSFTSVATHFEDEFVETVKSSVQEKKKLQLNGQLFSVKCCAHTFGLMAEDANKEVSDIIMKLHLTMSWNHSLEWYWPAFNLRHALKLESTGYFSTQQMQEEYDLPTVEEWEKARCVTKLVLSAYSVAEALFETEYPTANIFFHKLQELRSSLHEGSTSDHDFNSKIAKKMLERLDEYLNEVQFPLAIACVLDPRCKMRYIEYVSSKGEISGIKLQPGVVLDAIRSLYGEYVIREEEREHSMTDSALFDSRDKEEEEEDEEEDELPRNVEGEEVSESVLLQGYNQFIGSINQPPLKSDLDMYLEYPVVPWSKNFNALDWWRVEGPKYPILSKMARDILAIPMSVATSDDAYFVRQREADPRVMKSGPNSLRNIFMCTRSWQSDYKYAMFF